VVWLEATSTSRQRTSPRSETIQLQGRKFSPRVRAVTEGSRLDFPNQDSFSHNVFSKTPGGAFDTGLFSRGRTRTQAFGEAGIFPIYCNIHPRMTAYVVVVKTPWVAQAGSDGRFELAGVPAGQYTMHMWHDRASEVTRPITVSSAGLTGQRIELDARGYRYVQHKNKFDQVYQSASGDRY
ncbi:MAG: hypothetical protein H0W68_10925, partial [Gemmatimonadaceae bacterium]|nr:hypothetical protein [Gemmatimonadaceae bacterium]